MIEESRRYTVESDLENSRFEPFTYFNSNRLQLPVHLSGRTDCDNIFYFETNSISNIREEELLFNKIEKIDQSLSKAGGIFMCERLYFYSISQKEHIPSLGVCMKVASDLGGHEMVFVSFSCFLYH